MSARFVALLRGINVGRAKRVGMADLRALFEGLGFRDVRTLLNSGNVVFEATGDPAKLAVRIEKAVPAKTGVECRVLVLTADDLAKVVAGNRVTKIGTDHSRLFVGFLWEDSKELDALASRAWGKQALALGRRAAYLWCPDGFETPLVKAFHAAVGTGVTVRNWATVLKLQELARPAKPSVRPPAKAPRGRRARAKK